MLSKPGMFDEPSARASSLPPEDYIQPTLNHGLRVWWAYYWPTTLAVIACTTVGSFFLRVSVANGTLSLDAANNIAKVEIYVWTILVSVFLIRYILAKRFSHFRIALLPPMAAGTTTTLPRTARRTIRVWWAFIWRMVVYSVILRLASNIALGSVIAVLSLMGRTMGVLVPILSQVVIDGAVGLYVMYSAILDEEFGDFRVALLPRKSHAAVPTVAAAPPATTPASQ